MLRSLQRFLKFIRFSHTVFALPFALAAMLVAADGLPSLHVIAGVLAAMVTARTAAMTFNRLVDWEIDKRNPRTAERHTLTDRRTAVIVCASSSVAFMASAWWLNNLCFVLSPVALGIVFFYSMTKRFTDYAQVFLGLALAVAPVGGWLAVTGAFALPPLILALAVLLWVTGFDLIYASQDVEVDMAQGLRSLVVRLGVERAFRLALILHGLALAALVAFGLSAGLGKLYNASLLVVLGALVYEHLEAGRGSVSAINRAFFLANAAVGIAFVAGTFFDRLGFLS